MIQSVSYSQEEIIKNIIDLYIPKKIIDVDVTYSIGQFYKNGIVPEPTMKFDKISQREDVVECDCTHLPLLKNSVDSLMFDPPFLATTGKSLKNEDGNVINRRFGVYPNEPSLFKMYFDALKEFHRVLNDDGILIVKCQDKVSSAKQYMSHIYIANMAEECGFYVEDIFVLVAKNRLVANWQKNQKHSRKYHSYFYVFRKTAKSPMSYTKILKQIEELNENE